MQGAGVVGGAGERGEGGTGAAREAVKTGAEREGGPK